MLRDNLVELIEPMLSGAGPHPLAPRTNRKQSSDDRPVCLENPRPAGAESTLTENVASPFHAEPGQFAFGAFEQKREPGSIVASPSTPAELTTFASQTSGFAGGPYAFPTTTLP